MAGYSEKDIDTEEEWIPPTEAELKVIQARRDRSDRISKIMGSYLLKGYKMLASECPTCGVSIFFFRFSMTCLKILQFLSDY